ncbi:SDR family oxidoreductase [Pleionea litopenaei]|uniref:sulfoacetaldehyde reductase (NADPH) n=1 Tax=Pleionea litopenaei TaxID=3070815 RepID=A0AA51RQL7_9GAMM|nr:SDR family oxidoreductase [Pleionea sp. HL-JVS1]WMS85742.1 SDR family oxidoreductase [Pleionea sp. HL-JVS1]
MTKTVLITGASSGFGEACAHQFAALGYRLIICARRQPRIKALAEKLSEHTDVLADVLDVTDRQAVAAFVENLPDDWKKVDILVNNAGLALGLDPAHKASLDDWDTMIDTNIKGLNYLTRALLPSMVANNSGHVVNIGSIAGSYAYPGGNAYGATKAYVQQFSRNLRADLLGTQVRVTNIEPGLAETEFSVVRFQGDVDKAKSVYQGTHPLFADDIARAVVWAAQQPEHVNINSIEVMPTCQAWGPLNIAKAD